MKFEDIKVGDFICTTWENKSNIMKNIMLVRRIYNTNNYIEGIDINSSGCFRMNGFFHFLDLGGKDYSIRYMTNEEKQLLCRKIKNFRLKR